MSERRWYQDGDNEFTRLKLDIPITRAEFNWVKRKAEETKTDIKTVMYHLIKRGLELNRQIEGEWGEGE